VRSSVANWAALIIYRRYPVTEVVPAPEPAGRPALSPDPEQAWRPGPRRAQPPEEIGPARRHFEAAHVVLGLIALVIVVMLIMIALILTGFR
jgi:hypothetical protein